MSFFCGFLQLRASFGMLLCMFLGICVFNGVFVDASNTNNLLKSRNLNNPPEIFTIGAIIPISVNAAGTLISPAIPGLEFGAAYTVARINADPSLLPSTRLKLLVRDTFTEKTKIVSGILDMVEEGAQALVGPVFGVETEVAAVTASSEVSNRLIVSQNSGDSLNSKDNLDTLSRIVPPANNQGEAIYRFLEHLAQKSSQVNIGNQYAGYLRVAVVGTSTPYGISVASSVINFFNSQRNVSEEDWPAILTYQNVISTNQNPVLALDIDTQLQEVINSGARVIVYIGVGADLQSVLVNPLFEELWGPRYIWVTSDQVGQASAYLNLTNFAEGLPIVPELKERTDGFFSIAPRQPTGQAFQNYLAAYRDFFSFIPGFGLDYYSPYVADAVEAVARALAKVIEKDQEINASNLLEAVKNVSFTGITGHVVFDELADRLPFYDIVNVHPIDLRPEPSEIVEVDGNNYWLKVGSWNSEEGISIPFEYQLYNDTLPLRFFNGSTQIPNLDVRDPISYWSCKDAKKKVDSTGLIVQLETPDYDYPDDIASTYICDQFVDCNNMSDEGFDCTPSFAIAYTIIAAVTIILIVFNLLVLLPIVIIFGCFLNRMRLRIASPFFLVIIVLSSVVGLASTFAWYGKPHTAACIFRVWLLPLSLISVIAALFAKTFRIWRIFRNVTHFNRISDWELLILWALQLAPLILLQIGWTAFSTPMGGMEKADGTNHYLCSTGGLTNEPGGLVWFSLIVAYGAILLLIGIVLIFLIRKVPVDFKENKIIAVTLYNLTFLSVVVIPVYFVLINVSPLAAWLILMLAILYAFTATLIIQFAPIIFSLIWNRCQNPKASTSELSSSNGSSSFRTGTATMGVNDSVESREEMKTRAV